MGNKNGGIIAVNEMLTKYFDMEDMGLAYMLLLIKIVRTSEGIPLT